MDELLNPLHPKNPISFVGDGGKVPPPTPPPNTSPTNGGDSGGKGYREGVEPVLLPSKGVFYLTDQMGKFWNMESVLVRQLNYTDEDILTTRAYFENGTIFNEIL